jgi:hypothetical protein
VPQRLVGEHHRVGEDLPAEVGARVLLVGAVGVVAHLAGDVGPPEIRRQVAAAVRGNDAQVRVLVERAVEDQPRQEVRRLERVADDVAEIAAAAQRVLLEDVLGAAGVDEDRRVELRRLGPERVVLRQRQVFVVVAADRGAAQSHLGDRRLELLRRQVRMLDRDGRQRDEAIRVGGDDLLQPLVLRLDDARGEVAVGGVPPVAVDREDLHVGPDLVHPLDARRSDDLVAAAARALLLERRALDDLGHRHDAMRVDVDDADAASVDRDLAACRRLRVQVTDDRQPGHERAGRGAGGEFEEVSATGHG